MNDKLHSLSSSILILITRDKLPVDTLINVLEMIKEYALFLSDQDSRGQLAIMFFETVFGAVDKARRDNHRFKYLRILNTYMGNVSKEICAEFGINLIDAETL